MIKLGMKILAIDTSCDETAAAVVEDTTILSNIIWSQASAHAKFGGVMPSLAQRMHEERIDFVINKAIVNCKLKIENCDCIAVTIGPGLSIALGVGINKAKELAKKYKKPLIPINHLEGHVLSPFAISNSQLSISNKFTILNLQLPALGLVISGGNTVLVKMNKIGEYETLAATVDDALGEALDKAARMLGLGYPGGAILEKFAKLGDPKKYKLTIPLLGQEDRQIFSYSGLKTAMMRLARSLEPLNKQKIYDLATCFQDIAFEHLIRICRYTLQHKAYGLEHLLVGGGVAANVEVRKRLRKLGKDTGVNVHFPINRKLYGDNAAMIGLAANIKFKINNLQLSDYMDTTTVDRNPNLKL